MDDLYRDYILEHYRRPHNFGILEAPSASYEGNNPLCGDRITMQVAVRDGVIADIAFTGRGCAISQASASLLTDEVKGKPVREAAALTPEDVLDLLGIEISPARLKCALLSLDTLHHVLAAIPGAVVGERGETVPTAPAAQGAERPQGAAHGSDRSEGAGGGVRAWTEELR